MPNNRPKLTIRATGKVNRGKVSPGKARAKRSERRRTTPHSIRQLELVLDQQREIYNASLTFLEYGAETAPRVLKGMLRKEITQLRAAESEYQKTLRKISLATTERAIINHLRYAAPREGTKPAGRPRRKTQERFRTLILHSPTNPVIHFSTLGRAKLKLKGLPSIRLDSHQEIPRDQQPKSVHLTLRGRQISVRLVYDQEAQPEAKTHLGTEQSPRPGPGRRHHPGGIQWTDLYISPGGGNQRPDPGNPAEPVEKDFRQHQGETLRGQGAPGRRQPAGRVGKQRPPLPAGLAEGPHWGIPEDEAGPDQALRPEEHPAPRLPAPGDHRDSPSSPGAGRGPAGCRRPPDPQHDQIGPGQPAEAGPERPGQVRAEPDNPPAGLGSHHHDAEVQG